MQIDKRKKLEWLLIDKEVNHLSDFLDAAKGFATYIQAFMAKDEKKAQAAAEEYTGTTIKPFLSTFEKTLQNNKSGQDFLVGSKPSWADFVVVQVRSRQSLWSLFCFRFLL